MRMINLKEPLTKAEKELHEARKKLRELEAGQAAIKANPARGIVRSNAYVDIEQLEEDLNNAMLSLQF